MLLFLTDRKQTGLSLTRRLAEHGMTVLQESPEIGEYLCRSHRPISAVLIDGIPQASAAQKLCTQLRAQYEELPIALMLEEGVIADAAADRIIRRSDPETVAKEILQFCKDCGWHSTLSTYTLSVSDDPDQTYLLGYRLPLSPREHQIVRFLFLCAPEVVGQDELMSVCFPEGSQSAANLPVQIHHINRKARTISKLPLIENVYGKGYRLCSELVQISRA